MAPITANEDMQAEASPEAFAMRQAMRELMDRDDVDEFTMADDARELNAVLNERQDVFEEAWGIMGSKERAAWKRLLTHYRWNFYR